MQGLICCYINRKDYEGKQEEEVLQIAVQDNQALIDASSDSGWAVLFIPTTNEGTRIEKIDFDKPFPIPKTTVELKLETLRRKGKKND